MKYLYSFICLFIFLNVFSQEQPLYRGENIKDMAVFPGCEEFEGENLELNKCLSIKLTELLEHKISNLNEVLDKSGIEEAKAKIQFVISKEGVMLDFKETEGSNQILSDATIIALSQISNEIPPIKPAKLEDGNSVNIFFSFPITFKVKKENIELVSEPTYPVDEIVLFTLLEDSLRYEVRLFQNKSIKIYEIRDNQTSYLGKFLTLHELEQSEPYKTLIENQRNSERVLVADGYVNNEFFEIYIHNLFKKDAEKPIFVEVLKVVDNKKKLVSKFEKETDFNKSKFAPLIYRD